MFLSGTHLKAESTEAIWRLAEGHNILMLPGFEPSTAVFRNLHLADMTSVLNEYVHSSWRFLSESIGVMAECFLPVQ